MNATPVKLSKQDKITTKYERYPGQIVKPRQENMYGEMEELQQKF